MANVQYFAHSQANAPTISGTSNDHVALLEACLENGFNSQSVTSISVTSNVATLTTPVAHGWTDLDTIEVSGANEAVYNGKHKVTSTPLTTTLTFDLTTGDGSATGTLTAKTAPLDWAQVHSSGSSYRVWQMPGGTKRYLHLQDNNTRYAVMRLINKSFGWSSGDSDHYTAALYWHRSDVASASTRDWWLIGDDRTLYFYCTWDSAYTASGTLNIFGDFIPHSTTDRWATLLAGQNNTNPSSPTSGEYQNHCSWNTVAVTSIYMMNRAYGNALPNGAIDNRAFKFSFDTESNYSGQGNGTYPASNGGGVNLFRAYLVEEDSPYQIRGHFRGLYTPYEDCRSSLLKGDTSISINGEKYMFVFLGSSSTTSQANWFIKIDGEWEQ